MLQFTPNKGKGVDLFGKKKLPVSPETSLPEVPGIVPPNQSKAPPTGVPSEVPPQAFQGIDSEITGEQAIQQGKQAYLNNAQDIPQLTQQDALGSAVTGEAEEQSLSQQAGSELGARPGYHSVYNPETGAYEEKPMSAQDFQTQLDFEQQQDPSYAPSSMDFATGSKGDVQEKLRMMNEKRIKAERLRAMVSDKKMYGDKIIDEADALTEKEASGLESAAGRFSDAMSSSEFAPSFDAVFSSADENGQPHVDPAYRGTVVSLMALAEIDSSGRDSQRGDWDAESKVDQSARPRVVDSSGNILSDDADYVHDKINSIDSSLAIGLERAGIKMPSAQRRQLAAISMAQAMKAGDYKLVKGFNGSDVVIPTEKKINQRKELESAIKGTVTGVGRLAPSRVRQIAGADLIAGGPQVVSASRASFSIANKEAKAKAKATGNDSYLLTSDAAHMTQDIFGSIDERVPLLTAELYSKIYSEVTAQDQMSPEGFSNHPLADKLNLGPKAFRKLKGKYKPAEGSNEIGSSPEATQRREQSKIKHATKQMQQRLAERAQSFQDMQKLIAKPGEPGFFTGYTRSIINGRFYRNNRMTDIGADKDGARNFLNFGVQEGVQAVTLDPTKDGNKVVEMQRKMEGLRQHLGENFSAKLDEAFTPQEQQALGLMAMAVKEHRASKNPDWNRVSPIDLIMSYKADDFNYVADLGAKVDQWKNQKPEDIVDGNDPLADFKSMLAGPDGLSRGEFQDKLNLWYDFHAIKNLAGSRFHQPTALATLDGVQNGVFLTGLFTGSDKNLIALGSYNELRNGDTSTSLKDLRGILFNNIGQFIDASVGKGSEKSAAWTDLFKTLKKASGSSVKEVYDSFSKNPIMQYSYGKDASQFGNEMSKFLNDTVGSSDSADVLDKMQMLNDEYEGDRVAMVRDLKNIMNVALKNSIDNSLTEMNKAFGFGYAAMGRRPNIKDVTGDDVILGQSDLGIVQGVVDEGSSSYETPEGAQEYDLQVTSPNMANVAGLEFAQTEKRQDVGFAKQEKLFWDEELGDYTKFKPQLGTGLANQMGVVMVQATDASLLKLMAVHVNKDRKVPIPVRTVHDSLITSPRGYLHYTNAYNNVAIPQAKNSIKKYAQELRDDFYKQRDEVYDEVASTGVPVGIGSTGKFAVIGSYLDNLHEKFFDPQKSVQYRDNVFIKNKTPEGIKKGTEAFDSAQARAEATLKQARSLGWVPPYGRIRPDEKVTLDDILEGNPDARKYMAVKAHNFRKMFELVEGGLKLHKSRDWAADFSNNVDSGYSELKRVTKRTGIGQMSF